MANKIIVGPVGKIYDSPIDKLPPGTHVEFADGQAAWIDPGAPHGGAYREVLEELLSSGTPAYVEVDPATNAVILLLIPLEVKVADLKTLPSGDVRVELEPSSAVHVLKRTSPAFEQFLKILKNAQAQDGDVLVTEIQHGHEIIDVRPSPNPLQPAAGLLAPAALELAELSLRPVTSRRARELFDLVSNQSCDPAAIAAPCIPFLYPDDGCWARAHEMCRIILAAGEEPGKLWIYGGNNNLTVKTSNHPHCQVLWTFHVAPILQVTNGASTENHVIDPALFNKPVTETTWKGQQGNPNATLVPTDASAFLRSRKGSIKLDLTNTQTQKDLASFRLRLKLRSASSVGPPPYQCP